MDTFGTFINWLIGEAGIGCLIGVLTLLGGIAGAIFSWLKRERPTRVIVQELMETVLLDIHPAQRKNLSVFYTSSEGEQTRINNLIQKSLCIYNMGTKNIEEPLNLLLYLSERDTSKKPAGFWKIFFDSPLQCQSELLTDESGTNIGVKITLPFLNSYSYHQQIVIAKLVSEHPVEIKLVGGIGKGWSASYYTMEQIVDKETKGIRTGFDVLLAALIPLFFVTTLGMKLTLVALIPDKANWILAAAIGFLITIILALLFVKFFELIAASAIDNLFLRECIGVEFRPHQTTADREYLDIIDPSSIPPNYTRDQKKQDNSE